MCARPSSASRPRGSAAAGRAELKYHGRAACAAVWRYRPQDMIRIYLEQARVAEFAPLLRWAAGQRLAYHIVGGDELERLTETVHHQGICVLARERPTLDYAGLRRALEAGSRSELLLYLDGVSNPHNLGALLRSCAHFGVRFVLGPAERLPRLSPSVCRIAEGGAEVVTPVYLSAPTVQLPALSEIGFELVGTTVRGGIPLFEHRFGGRTVLMLGAEEIGMSAALTRLAAAMVTIPGEAAVESLNVSVAGGVLLSEYRRQRNTARPEGQARVTAPRGARRRDK